MPHTCHTHCISVRVPINFVKLIYIQVKISDITALIIMLFYTQASLSMAAAAHDCSNSHPSLLVKTNENGVVNEVFLICEKTIISPIKGVEAPIVI